MEAYSGTIHMEVKENKNENTASQLYIGTPAGVILCMDSAGLDDMEARLWHGYSKEAIKISAPEQMLSEMEALFELINYPRATTSPRRFSEQEESAVQDRSGSQGTPQNVPRYLTDGELLEKRGKQATFIIRVQQRQNSNWQGRITWVERDRTLRFRTIMEMVRLIENALGHSGDRSD
jgi:hypothetical protein